MDAYRRCRDYLDEAISLIKPGVSTADVVNVWPKAQEFGFANEEAAFAYVERVHGRGEDLVAAAPARLGAADGELP